MSSDNPIFTAPSLPAMKIVKDPSYRPEIPDRPRVALSGNESLEIANFTSALPEPTSARDRLKFVQAAETAKLRLSVDALHAVARAMVAPQQAASMVKSELYTVEIIESAHLYSIPTIAWTTELFPLLQPRTGASALAVAAPKVTGIVDEDGVATAALELRFKSPSHLREYLKQTVRETRRTGKAYDDSILARRVSRAVIAHEARLVFDDGTESIDVIVVRDGITRLVSSAAVRLGSKPTPDEIAEDMASILLTPKSSARAKDQTASQEFARGRDEYANDLRTRFARGIVGGLPTEDALRIGQTFTMPAQLYVGIEALARNPLAPEQQFDDAMRAVVSSIHVEFKGWEDAAENAEVADRAMQRVRHSGEVSADIADLASGVIDVTAIDKVFGDSRIPKTALWRAVYLVAKMCDPEVFAGMKRELRAILGISRIENSSYWSLLAPTIDLPWRSAKKSTLDQARSAWANKSPIPATALDSKWAPQPVDDFTSLIEPAMNGDRDARLTLQVAGGIALVTDKLLTANSGSKIVSGLVPFRSDVADVVTGLGDTEYGLWVLARAANAFDSKRVAANSLTKTRSQQINPKDMAGLYRIGRVDPNDPSKLITDNAGQAQLLTEWDVVTASNPTRAAEAAKDREGERTRRAAEAKAAKVTNADKAASLRKDLNALLGRCLDTIDSLVDLAASDGTVGEALSTIEEWEEINALSQQLTVRIFSNKPAPATAPGSSEDA